VLEKVRTGKEIHLEGLNGVKRRKQKTTTTATRGAVVLACCNFRLSLLLGISILIVKGHELGWKTKSFYAFLAQNS
jgi:hypothetical protein